MKIILFITIIFSNGTMVEDKIPFKSYDECYVNAIMLIQKIESQKVVDKMYVSCVEINGNYE